MSKHTVYKLEAYDKHNNRWSNLGMFGSVEGMEDTIKALRPPHRIIRIEKEVVRVVGISDVKKFAEAMEI